MLSRYYKHRILAVMIPLLLSAPVTHAADLIVSAATSLTNAFQDLSRSYEAQHPDTKIILNFAASDVLLQQIIQGAPVDVFASADQEAMNKAEAVKAIQTGSRKNFAGNQIVLIVPSDSRLQIKQLKDVTQSEIKRIAYGNPASVPVGRYTKAALESEQLWQTVTAKGIPAQNARQSLDYVVRGEVDAGFVFSTDAAIMPDKVKIALRIASPILVTYPISMTAQTQQVKNAAEFINYVLSPAGQTTLARYGFLKPR